MFQSKTQNDHHQACDDNEENSLSAGLLITSTITTTTAGGKYSRLWRRSLCVSIVISALKKNGQESPLPSPSSSLPYVPCPQEPLPAVASEQLNQISPVRSGHVIDVLSDNEEKEIDEEENLQDKVVRIVKEKDLNSLRKLGGVDRVVELLGSNLQAGIDGREVQQVWSTTNNPVDEKGFSYFFLEACGNYNIFLLLASAALSFAIDIKEHGPKHGWHDGVAILVAAVLIVAFSSVNSFRQERKREKNLLKNMKKMEVNVVRSGQSLYITISEVVVGDIVILKKGNGIPADGLLVRRDDLEVDEVLESADGLLVRGEDLEVDEVLNSKIDHDQNPFLFSGSKVIKGHGSMLVTSVGDNTAMGKALSLVTHDPKEKTLLQARIEEPNDYNELFAVSVSVLIALVVLIRLLCRKHNNSKDLPELKGNVSLNMLMKIFERFSLKSQGKIWILTSVLTAMVIGIQHAMHFVISISLCYWKEKVQPCEADIHNLSACGTMGLVTVIYMDATGGLMCDEVTVNKLFIGEKEISNYVNSETGGFAFEALQQGISLSVLAPEISVCPTNNALSSLLESKLGPSMEVLGQSFDILEYTKLSSVKKGSGVLMRRKDKDEQILHLHWSGAASTILGMCSHYYDSGGESHAIEDQLKQFEQVIKDMEDGGLRPIAFAYRQNEKRELIEEGLNLLAIVGLKYTCQEKTRSVVEDLRNAGVCVKLVSEEEPPAVRAIACELGIFRPGSNDVELKGEDIQELTSNGSIEKVELATVIGSCLPEDKLFMIQQLQQKGHIVAFFGGLSTSDSLALKEADLGITKDAWSTELARQSSDVTVKDFGSLVTILKFGRCGYHNIQTFIQLQLTTCISGLLIALVTTIITGTSPITGLELFWVNWLMCLLGSQVMIMELKGQELLTNKPAIGPQSLITKVMWRNIAIQVIYQASVFLIFQFKGQVISGMNDGVRKTMIFNAFFLCQIFHQFNAMDLEQKEVLSDVLHSCPFLVTLAAVMTMQVMVIELLGIMTNFVRLNAVQWASCFVVAALSWGFDLALNSLADILAKSVDSHYRLWNRMPRPCVFHFAVPFFMFLCYALPGLVAVVNQYDNIVPPACE